MILRFPRDIAFTNECKKLSTILGDDGKAMLMFFALWVQLGYECESSGVAGFMADTNEFVFQNALPFPCDTPIRILETCGLLIPQPGGWRCPMFEFYNRELDSTFVSPDIDASWLNFRGGQKTMQEETPQILLEIPPASWHPPGREKLEEFEMRRVVLLVKTIDAVLRTGKRAGAEYEVMYVSAACDIIRDYSDTKITVILKRCFEVSRRRGLPKDVPRNTLKFMENWEDVAAALMPSDGYIRWTKRSQHASMEK